MCKERDNMDMIIKCKRLTFNINGLLNKWDAETAFPLVITTKTSGESCAVYQQFELILTQI